MNEHVVHSPLLFQPKLQQRETGPGFASRLAAMNGHPMGELFTHMGIRHWAFDNGDRDAIRAVSILGNADFDRLIAFTPRTVDGKREYHVAGEIFGPLGIGRTDFRYCPCCVAEDLVTMVGPKVSRPWLRLEWTVNHYRACHVHDARLLPGNAERRRFQGFDFSETIAFVLPFLEDKVHGAIAAPPSMFNRWLVDRLDGKRNPANWLDAFPLHAAAQWCEALGVSVLHPSKVQTSKLTEAQWGDAADAGFTIASAGVGAIREFLAGKTRAEKRTRGIVGPRDTFGYAYHLLEKTKDDPAFEPIRTVVRDFAVDALPWRIGTDLLGVVIDETRVVTVTTAAQLAGADRKTIRKIVDRKGLARQALRDGDRNHRVMLEADEIMPALRKLKGAMTLPQTMKYLGIERRQVQALVDAGALPPAAGIERGTSEQHRFAVDDVDAMMVKLTDGAIEVQHPTERQVDIPTARHIAGATTVDVLKLVFESRLRWKGRLAGRHDYMALLLDADEVAALVRADAPQFTNLRFCDVETVVTGLTQKSIQPLIDIGLLLQTSEYSPNARRMVPVVTAASVGAFRLKYVTAGELCQQHGLHHKQVKYRLLDAGVDMEFDQGHVKAMIYDRAKVERAAAGRAGFWNA